MKKTTALHRLLKRKDFVYMPVAYDALGGRLLQSLGFDCVYTGGFVTGASRCTSGSTSWYAATTRDGSRTTPSAAASLRNADPIPSSQSINVP